MNAQKNDAAGSAGKTPPGPPKFPLGALVMTPGAEQALPFTEICAALLRHLRGDWGELDPEDLEANNAAVICGSRLLSAWSTREKRIRFWIITESDRSVTTVLLPSEY